MSFKVEWKVWSQIQMKKGLAYSQKYINEIHNFLIIIISAYLL